MTNPASAFLPAIEALEKDLDEAERNANALLTSVNLLREKAGLPPRPGGFATKAGAGAGGSGTGSVKLHSDTFTGKKLGVAVREFLEMRKKSGIDAPATSREIYDALKDGGFTSGAKDEETALVVLRTLLRKNTTTFAKLANGKYGLRAWYPDLKARKEEADKDGDEADGNDDAEVDAEKAA